MQIVITGNPSEVENILDYIQLHRMDVNVKNFSKPTIVNNPTGLVVTKFTFDDKKILIVTKRNEGEVDYEWHEIFLVEHLLDDKLNITEQTLEREKEMFPPCTVVD